MAYVFYFGVGFMCRNDVRNEISYVCAYTLMATATTRRPGVHSKLRNLSEDGGPSQVYSVVTLRPAKAANRAR